MNAADAIVRGLLVLVMVGCGAARGTSSGDDARCWPIESFRIDALEHGTEWEPVFIVSEDGSVRRPGSPKVRGRFTREGDRDVFTFGEGHGSAGEVVTCGSDHVVAASRFRLTYTADDALEDAGLRIEVDREGEVHMGAHQANQRARVRGNVGRVRRAAVLLTLLSMAL